MRINVRVKPNAGVFGVLKIDENNYEAKVDASPIDGRANERLVELLAEYFGVPESRVRILRGLKSRNKIVEVTV
jgi:uncharacterized protein (TIGR00251 family)